MDEDSKKYFDVWNGFIMMCPGHLDSSSKHLSNMILNGAHGATIAQAIVF